MEKERKYLPYPVLGAIPPGSLFGDHDMNNDMIHLMTADEKIEELQNIIDQRDQNNYAFGKENNQNETVKHLEHSVKQLMKVNEALVTELHDKNYMNQDIQNKIEREANKTEHQLETRITDAMVKMGNSSKNAQIMKDLISHIMNQFKNSIIVETNTSNNNNIHEAIRKSESFKPTLHKKTLKRSNSSSESGGTPKSNQGTYSSTFDAQVLGSKTNRIETPMHSTPKMATKPINKMSNKHYYKPKKQSNTANSQKQLSSTKSGKSKANSKYLNFIEGPKSKHGNEQINIVPLNEYTPDFIKSALQRNS